MEKNIDIQVELDPSREKPKIIIQAGSRTKLIENIIHAIERSVENDYPPIAAGDGGKVVMLEQWEILRVYTENRRVRVCTESRQYEGRNTLQELEELLDINSFVRISRFEIVNFRKIRSFDLSISGTIKLYFENGTETWVARRYVRAIQQKLRANRRGGESNE